VNQLKGQEEVQEQRDHYKLDALREDLEKRDIQIESLKQDLKHKADEVRSFEEAVAGLGRKAEERDDLNLDLEARLDTYKGELEAYKASQAKLKASSLSCSQKLDEQVVLVQSLTEIRSRLEGRLDEHEGEERRLKARCETLESENEDLSGQLWRLREASAKQQPDDQGLKQLEKALAEEQLEITRLQTREKGMLSKIEDLETQLLYLSEQATQQSTVMTTEEVESVKNDRPDDLGKLSRSLKGDELEVSYRHSEAMEKAALDSEVSLSVLKQQLKVCQDELAEKVKAIELMTTQVSAWAKTEEDYQEKVTLLEAEIKSLRIEVSASELRLQANSDQPNQTIMYNALRKAIEMKGQENQKLEHLLEKTQIDLKEKILKTERYKSRIDSLKDELSSIKSKYQVTEEERLRSSSVSDSLEQRISDAEFQVLMYKNSLKQKEFEIESLTKHCEEIELQVEKFQRNVRMNKDQEVTSEEVEAAMQLMGEFMGKTETSQQLLLSQTTARLETIGRQVTTLTSKVQQTGPVHKQWLDEILIELSRVKAENLAYKATQQLGREVEGASMPGKDEYIEQMQGKLQSLEVEVGTYKARVQDLTEVEHELSTKLDSVFKSARATEEERLRLESQLKSVLESIKGGKKTDMIGLIQRNRELEKEVGRLHMFEDHSDELELKVKSLNDKVKFLMVESEDYLNLIKKLSSDHKQEVAVLACNLDLKSKYAAQMTTDIDVLTKQNDELKDRLDNESSAKQGSFAELTREYDAALFKIKLLEEQLNAADAEDPGFPVFQQRSGQAKETFDFYEDDAVVEFDEADVSPRGETERTEEDKELVFVGSSEQVIGEGLFNGKECRVVGLDTEIKLFIDDDCVFSSEDWLLNPEALRLSLDRVAKALGVPVDQAEMKLYEVMQSHVTPLESRPERRLSFSPALENYEEDFSAFRSETEPGVITEDEYSSKPSEISFEFTSRSNPPDHNRKASLLRGKMQEILELHRTNQALQEKLTKLQQHTVEEVEDAKLKLLKIKQDFIQKASSFPIKDAKTEEFVRFVCDLLELQLAERLRLEKNRSPVKKGFFASMLR
jgi:chromosome segregation ATPase